MGVKAMTVNEYSEDGIRHVDHWVVLKVIEDGEVNYRLLSSTDQTFFDRWRLNSGIVNFTLEQGLVDFYGYSGSVYRCGLEGERLSSIMASVLAQWQSRSENPNYSIRAISFEQFRTEWVTHKPKWN